MKLVLFRHLKLYRNFHNYYGIYNIDETKTEFWIRSKNNNCCGGIVVRESVFRLQPTRMVVSSACVRASAG